MKHEEEVEDQEASVAARRSPSLALVPQFFLAAKTKLEKRVLPFQFRYRSALLDARTAQMRDCHS